jgi:hypothetical protein
MLNERNFRAICIDYLESGLKVRDFCSNQHMNEVKFYYWQHRMKGLLPPQRDFYRKRCHHVLHVRLLQASGVNFRESSFTS